MEINYSLIAKKPFITWTELVWLLFGCKDKLHGDRYDTSENLKIRRVQDDFRKWFYDALEARELPNYTKSGGNHLEYFKGKKENVFSWIQKNGVFDWLRENGIEPPEQTITLVGDAESEPVKKTHDSETRPTTPKDKPSPKPENCFKPDGQDNWRITFKGKELGLIKSSDGVQYISLIVEKKEPIPSEQLYRFCKMVVQEKKGVDEAFLDKDKKLSGIATQHPEDPTIDGNYLKDLKKAKIELEKTIDGIKETNYLGDALLEGELCEKEDQLKKINDHLGKNTRPDKKTGKTKPTTFNSEAKDASGKIYHALKAAYKNIQKESPELAEHLKSAIKREDNRFSYNPPKDSLIDWEVILK